MGPTAMQTMASSASPWAPSYSRMTSTSQSDRSMGISEVTYEVQVLLARIRRLLLKRSRSQGNWVSAFAQHDTTGRGVLNHEQFEAFLASLVSGLSRYEIRLVAERLTRGEPGATITLGCFSDALERHGRTPEMRRFGEAWVE